MTRETRTLLGRSSSLTGREAVWQLADGLEIQSREHYEVQRKRVLFEDVCFVTYHREYGVLYLITTGLASLFFLGIAIAIVAAEFEAWPVAIPFLVLGIPAFVALLIRVMFRLDIITVFGKRTKASIRFRLRKQRARETYAQIVATVRSAQRRIAAEIAKEEAALAPASGEELPPMPPVGNE